MLRFSSESGGFCRIPVTEWDICCGSTGQREGRRLLFLRSDRRGLMTGMEEMVAGEIWMVARSISYFFFFFFPLSSWDSIFFIFIRYNRPFADWPPFFVFLFFWRGLMESRFHYNNVLVMWAFWEARCGLRWLGHGTQVFVVQSDLCSR